MTVLEIRPRAPDLRPLFGTSSTGCTSEVVVAMGLVALLNHRITSRSDRYASAAAARRPAEAYILPTLATVLACIPPDSNDFSCNMYETQLVPSADHEPSK